MVAGIYIVYWPESDVEYPHPEVLIHRRYHHNLPEPRHLMERFKRVYEATPFLYDPQSNLHFIQSRHHDLIFLLVSTNPRENSMSLVVVLNDFKGILQRYIDKTELLKETIIDNFNLIYELFDECLDFGVVQITDYNLLKEYIKVEVNLPQIKQAGDPDDPVSSSDDEDHPDYFARRDAKRRAAKKKRDKENIKSTHGLAVRDDVLQNQDTLVNSAILKTTAGAINWRPKGVYYVKNEIYLDIVEDCEYLHDFEAEKTLRNQIDGTCSTRCYLSGMPICKLGFNEDNISGIERDERFDRPSKRESSANLIGNVDDDDDEEDEVGDEEEDVGFLTKSSTETQEPEVKAHEVEEMDIGDSLNQSAYDQTSAVASPANTVPGSTSSLDLSTMTQQPKPEPGIIQTIPAQDITGVDAPMISPTGRQSRIPIRNVVFHQCTQLSSIYNDNLLSFIPPDDRFTLMSYHVDLAKSAKKLPIFSIEPRFRIKKADKKLQIMCVLSANYKRRIHCRDLVVKIPVSPHIFHIDSASVSKLKYKAEMGEVGFKLDSSEIIWKFRDLTGRKTVKMMAELHLESTTDLSPTFVRDNLFRRGEKVQDEGKDDDSLDRFYGVNGTSSSAVKELIQNSGAKAQHCFITMAFSIPSMAYSGLKVTYLTVDEEQMKYTCFPWVKYITRTTLNDDGDSDYRFRLGPSNFSFMD
ncbi:hypothetical protein DICA1_F31076 [Diutina catenulata]